MNINTDNGLFTISIPLEDESITESINMSNLSVNLNNLTLICPNGEIRIYNKDSPIHIIEDLLKNPPHQKEKHIYDKSLIGIEFNYFYCTHIVGEWSDSVYHGILIDTKGKTHLCYVPYYIYIQIPSHLKNVISKHSMFKLDNYGNVLTKS